MSDFRVTYYKQGKKGWSEEDAVTGIEERDVLDYGSPEEYLDGVSDAWVSDTKQPAGEYRVVLHRQDSEGDPIGEPVAEIEFDL